MYEEMRWTGGQRWNKSLTWAWTIHSSHTLTWVESTKGICHCNRAITAAVSLRRHHRWFQWPVAAAISGLSCAACWALAAAEKRVDPLLTRPRGGGVGAISKGLLELMFTVVASSEILA
jgi:hypothetical protein